MRVLYTGYRMVCMLCIALKILHNTCQGLVHTCNMNQRGGALAEECLVAYTMPYQHHTWSHSIRVCYIVQLAA
jgi:hypothetical protein